ncbi:hypothetical protein LRP30_31000 [Bradyrhizobium sp. C-145]|uniref:hypothetical protein n=1 Tax=Bradyrhizobium sp. C-145 TaxID=574727 RepID=UPI00201B7D62|nr:hypothetical protein [Bradyrhizobium sp. C-145]UQR61346.1 hypothetical protein LRP30_31000 [Bradyrhizobium sp. C-145]
MAFPFLHIRANESGKFESYGCPNKQSLAKLIANQIPAFEQYAPPPRKPWMSEDCRAGLFDAAALALTFFGSNDNPFRVIQYGEAAITARNFSLHVSENERQI